MGLTPQYAIGVWVGHDDNRPLGPKQTGGALALPVFVDTLAALGPRAREFVRPPGVVEARVDRATGLLAPPGADDASSYVEVFLAGTAPTETALVAGEVDTQTFVGSEYDDPPPPAPDAEETEPVEPAPAAPAAAPP